jgi:hypothetical protein
MQLIGYNQKNTTQFNTEIKAFIYKCDNLQCMSSNDAIILDSSIKQKKKEIADDLSDEDFFEIFTFEQILKNYELSYEDICYGKVGQGDDGGIDGFFFFTNGDLIKEIIDPEDYKKKPVLDVFVIQSKRSPTFSESVFQKINTTIQDIFDLSKDMEALRSFYNEDLIERANIFRKSYLNLTSKHPVLRIYYFYASKGDKSDIHKKINNIASLVKEKTDGFFTGAQVVIEFFGAKELLELSRIEKTYTLSLKFIENVLSKGRDNYVLLANIKDFYDFSVDDNSNLRNYIFESNVRDFQGYIEVNKDIKETLNSDTALDFWWLNNGITILASDATVTGKTITLDDVQIINGLQTTHCIFDYFKDKEIEGQDLSEADKNRSILVKIIIISNEEARDKIIKATNFQTSIPPASLKATEKIHHDIEDFFKGNDLYYDRRKNYYKNIGKPINKIISIPLLTQSLNTILRKEPHVSRARPASLVKTKEIYDELFNESLNPNVHLFCAKLIKKAELKLKQPLSDYTPQEKTNLKFHICMAIAMKLLSNKTYNTSDIENLSISEIGDDLIDNTISEVIDLTRDYMEEKDLSLEFSSKSGGLTEYLKANIQIECNC